MKSALLPPLPLLVAFLACTVLFPADAAKHQHKTNEETDEVQPRRGSSHGDDDEEGESTKSSAAFSLPGANSRGMIAQCQCEELDSCRAKTRKQFHTCKEKCVSKLQNPDWDADEGRRCFAWKERSKSRQCWEALKKQSCTKDSGVMIPVNATIQFHHHQNRQQRHRHAIHRDNDEEEEESTPARRPRKTKVGSGMDDSELEPASGSSSSGAHRHHHQRRRSGFMNMIKKSFGESGQGFLSCLRDCFRAQRGKHCTKELKCGLKRLPREDLREEMEKCREVKRKEQKEMCSCLEKAGVKKIDCGNGAEADNKLH